MRPTRTLCPELLPATGIGTARRAPRKGWRREAPGENGGAPNGTTTAPEGGSNDPGETKPEGEPGKAPTIDGDFDPDRAKRAIAAARAGEEKARQAAKAEKERVAAILKAAGLTADGKEDPEAKLKELADRATAAEARAAALATRDAVRTAAGKHDADAELLLDSNSFAKKLAGLDTNADDYADKVADLVKAEVKANSRYAKTPPPAGGRGVDHNGGGGTTRPQGLGAAIAARMNS